MDNVSAFSSPDECSSAVIPGYPIAIVPLVDTVTTERKQTGKSTDRWAHNDDNTERGRIVPVAVTTHFFALLQLKGFSGSFVFHST